jgi:peptide-methionine (S)-S-oxide reductase
MFRNGLILLSLFLGGAVMSAAERTELAHAYFGGGCFWCVEAVFERVPGVVEAVSGYAGGHVANPTYEQIGTGRTGHAEVVRVDYDPKIVSYETLLAVFWQAHDPTTLNRQGADVGPQYRSIILTVDEAQRTLAEKSRAAAQAAFDRPIVTEIVPFVRFYEAEDYHQDYFARNPTAGYCVYVIAPKLRKLGKLP